jgi:NADH-quinone oxidoreductase subunit L
MAVHSFTTLPFMLAAGGVITAWYCYLINPAVPTWIKKQFHFIYVILDNKYYMDKFNEVVFAGGARRIGSALSNVGDRNLIDGLIVNGSGRVVNWCSGVVRTLQTELTGQTQQAPQLTSGNTLHTAETSLLP